MRLKIVGLLTILVAGAIYLGLPYTSDASTHGVRIRVEPVKIGAEAPDFTLEDISGRPVTLSDARGKMATVLVFFRGYWCPFCAKQLGELRSLLKNNEPAQLLAISVDTHDQAKGLADKIAADGKGEIKYPMLSDPGHKIIDAYGLHDDAYTGKRFDGIPRASIYIIDKAGRVAWAKNADDYKVRPTNAEIRAALDSLK